MTNETIARYLENGYKGRKNAVSSRELERTLAISGNELRKRVNRLRRDTVPIAADQRGYLLCPLFWRRSAYPPRRRQLCGLLL